MQKALGSGVLENVPEVDSLKSAETVSGPLLSPFLWGGQRRLLSVFLWSEMAWSWPEGLAAGLLEDASAEVDGRQGWDHFWRPWSQAGWGQREHREGPHLSLSICWVRGLCLWARLGRGSRTSLLSRSPLLGPVLLARHFGVLGY